MGSSGCVEILPALVDAKGDLIVATANDVVTRLPVGSNAQVLTVDPSVTAGMRWATPTLGSDMLTVGEETMGRGTMFHTTITSVSGQLRLNYFTARKTETTTQVRIWTGTVSAAPTPTLCKFGLWQIDANGNGTLVASTANDTTLFAAVNTSYTRSWIAPYAKVAGQRYATGVLIVSALTMPQFIGSLVTNAVEQFADPATVSLLSGLADVGDFVAGSVTGTIHRSYMVVLP